MNTPPNDGGPAFPVPYGQIMSGNYSLTMRDWFAGQALAGYFAAPYTQHRNATDCAAYIYEMADAMIAARNSDIHQTADQLRRGIRGIIVKPDFTNPEEMVRRLDDLLSNTNTTAQ